jgi:hypothetical protein
VARYRLTRREGEDELPPVDHYTLRDLREGQTLSYNGERWAIESIEPFEGAGPEPYAGLLRAVRDERAREV